jgi:hypothetical protein
MSTLHEDLYIYIYLLYLAQIFGTRIFSDKRLEKFKTQILCVR